MPYASLNTYLSHIKHSHEHQKHMHYVIDACAKIPVHCKILSDDQKIQEIKHLIDTTYQEQSH